MTYLTIKWSITLHTSLPKLLCLLLHYNEANLSRWAMNPCHLPSTQGQTLTTILPSPTSLTSSGLPLKQDIFLNYKNMP